MADAGTTHKAPNHDLSEMRCPVGLADVDLFGPGAQEHWYESYEILHAYAPVHCLPGEGMAPGTDAYVLTKHEDIAAVVRDQKRFLLPSSAFVRQLVESGEDPNEAPNINVMVASMATLRPNPEHARAVRGLGPRA